MLTLCIGSLSVFYGVFVSFDVFTFAELASEKSIIFFSMPKPHIHTFVNCEQPGGVARDHVPPVAHF